MQDAVDAIAQQWAAARPDVDVSPMGVVGRLSRASRLLERGIKEFFAEHGLEPWEFDMLATLLRGNPEHTMCMKDLGTSALVSPGALTNRMDRLVERGLVKRWPLESNRRMVMVALTEDGERLAGDLLGAHMANEARLLSALSPEEQAALTGTLRKLLVSLGDTDL
ncbi:MarR family winged helix-turn-helix transcriptional regulator [Nonomuraea typhae]|uniref:MarR family winged helix-turn-helix transcriptional regulator n=1 Tax=Nonomuraea typhae TaxID=2603600 RepID=UPI0015E2336E|nr:MarR family transcriptional regulator [Nonomuraea typhae]